MVRTRSVIVTKSWIHSVSNENEVDFLDEHNGSIVAGSKRAFVVFQAEVKNSTIGFHVKFWRWHQQNDGADKNFMSWQAYGKTLPGFSIKQDQMQNSKVCHFDSGVIWMEISLLFHLRYLRDAQKRTLTTSTNESRFSPVVPEDGHKREQQNTPQSQIPILTHLDSQTIRMGLVYLNSPQGIQICFQCTATIRYFDRLRGLEIFNRRWHGTL